jgi:DNA-binding NarL/FixJ family response regulator
MALGTVATAGQRPAPAPAAALSWTTPRRILLIDDQPMLTEALAEFLADDPRLSVVGQARSGGEALAAVHSRNPDLVVLDAELGSGEGLELLPRLLDLRPELLVAMLTETESVDVVVEALRLGVSAWVPKSEPVERLLEVLVDLRPGDCYVPPRLLGRAVLALVRALQPPAESGPLAGLTPREREVLQCMVDGAGRDLIAGRLCLSPNTIRTHTQNVLGKLGVHSVVEAVAVGLRCGMRPSSLDSL